MSSTHPLFEYIRPSALKTANCPGCGNGILAQAILRAIDEEGISMDDFVFVSGIGCAAWIPSPFFHGDTLHTTHGRPIAFATGLKLAAPDRRVMVISGDGDLLAIGGNHFIHAARRNIDMVVICVNNGIYGMTGGQVAPTTPLGLKTVTSPYGNVENEFDIAGLAIAAGATYAARWTVYQTLQITKAVRKALNHKGFSLLEILSHCPVHYGKKAGMNSVKMFDGFKERSVTVAKAAGMTPEEKAGKIIVGELLDIEKPVLDVELARQREELRKGAADGQN
ncbi:MAG: thiamine pyrophosphate-dependent enzyme [Candidatus Latescibacter sp.]|nr:thiamine pyrophosphate-dependent enzyme [Candidatus Latescibacter sp.]